jgi:hypothetical protein
MLRLPGCCVVTVLLVSACAPSSPNDQTLEASSVSICGSAAEGGSASVSCPAGQVISAITFASYGSPTGACGAFKTSTCNATTSTTVVQTACIGKSTCTVSASNTAFGDPCRGTDKKLDIQAVCTAQPTCGSAAEGSSLTLSCPSGTTIASVTFASYGNPAGTCGAYKIGTCNAATSASVVKSACVGKSSCVVAANNTTFGDPCKGVDKELVAQVACSSSGGGGTGGTGGGGGTGGTGGTGGGGGTGGTGGTGGGGGGGTGGTGGGGGGGTGGTGGGGGGGTGGSGGGGGGSLLKFAVFGDCRPPNNNDTTGYPTAIIDNVFSRAQSNGAQFAIGTGDYMFASTSSAVSAQVQLFQKAEAHYTAGPIYLTMGNHECTGATASNCPNLNETPNVQAFMNLLPSGVTKPYYRIDVATPNGPAKFIFIAANAWSSAQSSWLTQQLAQPTTYTFVVRHESVQSPGVPSGVTESESIVLAHPYTLELLGHTHEYKHVDTQHVISGNAGAPLSSGTSYGLLIVEQQTNGNITVSEIDESTGNVGDTWTVSPTGKAM